MRKFTLCWMLILYSMASVAQELAEGWYQMKLEESDYALDQTAIDNEVACVVNAESEYLQKAGFYYPFIFSAENEKLPMNWVHIKVVNNRYQINALNGHVLKENATSTRVEDMNFTATSGENLLPVVASNGLPDLIHHGIYSGGGRNNVGRYGSRTSRYSYTQATEEQLNEYDIYTVEITGVPESRKVLGNEVSVECTNDANGGISSVFNHGYFFLVRGTQISTSDFIATQLEHYRVDITIENNVISVNYVHLISEELQGTINLAESALEKNGLGCPVEAERQTLTEAIAAARTALNGTPTEADATAFSTAYNNYISTTNVLLPEDGKAYTFTGVMKNGVRRYMNYTADGYTLVETTETDNANYPESTKLICHLVASENNYVNTYVFTNPAGKYFIWKGGSNAGFNSNKGYSDEYVETTVPYCQVKIKKLLNESGSSVSADSNRDLLGAFTVYGYRNSNNGIVNYFVLATTGGYDQADGPFYNNNYSSAIVIEETAYPNTVKLNVASGIDGIERIGTWSAPFPTLVPEGVKAYYVTASGTEEGASVAYTIQVPDGQAIPGHTGVLLTSTDASVTSATLVPAAAEELATIRTNLLGNSAGADKEIPTDEYAYILTGKNGVVGFYRLSATSRTLGMNKSYLTAPANENGEVASFSLKMGFGDETVISSVVAEAHEADAPVYDLCGRRVAEPTRSGIYISNGKKFMVK